MRTHRVGSGITRHEQTTYDAYEYDDFVRDSAGYIYPHENFIGWLDQREARLVEALRHFRLPEPNRMIVYDKDNLREWRYEDNNNLGSARTEWYLQAFPYQTSFWFLGRLLFLIQQCRLAYERGTRGELAGRALALGILDAQFKLKFSGEKRLAAFEKHVVASNKGNERKQQRAKEWKAEARKIMTTHPDIDPTNPEPTAAARAIRNAWPRGVWQPSERTLRDYVSMRGKTGRSAK